MLAGASTLFLGSAVLGASVAHATVDCLALTPAATAAENRTNIQNCLDATAGVAYLTAATFEVSGYLTVDDSDLLTRVVSATTRPVIRLTATKTDGGNLLRFVGSSATVSWLEIDANARLGHNARVIEFVEDTVDPPNSNYLEHNKIVGGHNPSLTTPGEHASNVGGATTVSIACSTCSGNLIYDNEFTNNYKVLTFRGSTTTPNVAQSNNIHDNQCDAASFVTYGKLLSNTMSQNGAFCGAGRGGGIYANGNGVGGWIEDNTISNTCGHGIDLLNGKNFTIHGNTVTAPGTRSVDSSHNWCGRAAAISLINISESDIEDNYASNTASWNMRSFDTSSTTGFQNTGAAAFSDLPNDADTLMAFQLISTLNASWTSHTNDIRNNTWIASCSLSDCIGLSAFISRNTGMKPDLTSSSTTWNKFRGNKVYGSEYRTVRGGKNWWAASLTCDERADWALDGCNDDDYQHNAPTGTANRNDVYSPAGTTFSTYS